MASEGHQLITNGLACHEVTTVKWKAVRLMALSEVGQKQQNLKRLSVLVMKAKVIPS